jgi:hypothetical protein
MLTAKEGFVGGVVFLMLFFIACAAGQVIAQNCSADQFIIEFGTDVEIIFEDSIVVTGIASVDSLNRMFVVTGVESLFILPPDMAPADSALYESLGLGRTYLFTMAEPIVDSLLVATYAADPDVIVAELDCEIAAVEDKGPLGIFPDDPFFGFQWGFHNDKLNAGWPDADKNAPEGWLIEQNAALTAILDTGIDKNHDDLWSRIWRNDDEMGGEVGVDDDGNGYVDDEWGWNWADDCPNIFDNNGHGTHVAGIAGAEPDNDIGVAGQGWTYRFMMILKVLDGAAGGQSSWIAQGIFYAAVKGAKVINLSLGSYNPSALIRNSIDFAYGSGCVIIAAMGNDDTDLPFYPAAYENVIAVGATDGEDFRAWFSNHGTHIDVVAPGNDIYSTLPGDDYGWGSGTSMAAPHVSGLAALILGGNPGMSAEWVRYIIRSTSDDEIGDVVEDVAGFDEHFGYGRINDYSTLAHVVYPAYLPLLEDVRISSTRDSMTYLISQPSQPCGEKLDVVGVRMPQNTDFQLTVSDSLGLRFATGTPDDPVEFIVMHERTYELSTVMVDADGECGKYAIEWATPFGCFPTLPFTDSEFGPFMWPSGHVVQICCLQLHDGFLYDINLDPVETVDLGMALFRPYPGPDNYYDRWSAVSVADTSGAAGPEVLTHAADTTAYYTVAIWSNNGRHSEYYLRIPRPTAISEVPVSPPPGSLSLVQNRPNPFTTSTAIKYGIADRCRVILAVYDVGGRKVATLIDQDMEPDYYTAYWDGTGEDGNRVCPGIYFCTLEAAGRTKKVKMVLAK